MTFSLRRYPAFVFFWSSQSLSNLGDAFSVVGLQLLVIQETGSIVKLALLTSIWGIARIAATVLAGPLVDAVDRRKLMLFCDAGRALLLLAMPLGQALGVPALPLIYGLMVLVPTLGAFFEVAYISVVPELVDAEHIERANTLLWTSRATATALGPVLAGLISYAWGPTWALGLDGATFALSGFALCAIRFRPRSAGLALSDIPGATAGVRGLTAGVRFVLRDSVLLPVTVVGCALGLMSQGGTNLVMFRLKSGLEANDVMVGAVLAIGSVGGIAGTIVASWVNRRFGLARALAFGMTLQGLGTVWLALAWFPLAMAPGVLIVILGDWLQGTITMSLYQRRAPEALRGRVVSAQWTLRLLVAPVGTLLIGMVAADLGTATTLLAMAGFFLALAVTTSLLLRRAEVTPARLDPS